MIKLFIYGCLLNHRHIKQNATVAFLPDYDLKFIVQGDSSLEPCYATIVHHPGHSVWGVIANVGENLLAKLKDFEQGYDLQPIVAIDINGIKHNCYTFIANDHLLQAEVIPSAHYAKQMYKGAKFHKLPSPVIANYHNLMLMGPRISLYLSWLKINSLTKFNKY
jgi:gamma-glutamylcyclotransferase (GGCT)/AIG2-like uncharacterized protein YtfP